VVATPSDAMLPAARRRLWLLAPLAVSLLAGGLASIHVRRSFTLAEVESLLQSHRPWRELVPVWHANAGDSVYLGLLKGWLHVGSSEWVTRVPSVVAVACTAAVVYALGARLFDRSAGLAAGVLFATSAYTLGAGREAEPVALAMLAATVATWLFVTASESEGRIAWSAYAVVAAASVYVHASCVLVLVAHAAMLFFRPGPNARRAVAVTALASALSAPAVVAVLATHRHLVDPLHQPSLSDVARAMHDASGRNVLLLALAAGGAAALALGLTPRADTSKLALLATWATAPPAGVLIFSIARPSLDPRYLAVSTPALCLLAAVGLVARPRGLSGQWPRWMTGGTGREARTQGAPICRA
jgi:mannosyltransferase